MGRRLGQLPRAPREGHQRDNCRTTVRHSGGTVWKSCPGYQKPYIRLWTQQHCVDYLLRAVCFVATELLNEWRQLDSDIELLLQTTHSVTSFNATDELKVDILQSSLNSTPSNWVTGSARSRDTCHVQLMRDNGGFLQQTPSSRQVSHSSVK